MTESRPRYYLKKATRTCLRCNKSFNSTGPGNRICGHCSAYSKTTASYGPVTRGEKRHRGEVISYAKD